MKSLNYYLSRVFVVLFLGFSAQMNAAQRCGVIGGTSFVKTGATATERYCLNDPALEYYGSVVQSFETNGTTFACRTTGNLTRANGGDYTIVQNVASVNGPDGNALQNSGSLEEDGTFLITPTNNNRFASYSISGLVPGSRYTVKIRLRSARVMQSGMNCNDEPAKLYVQINRSPGVTSSTNFNGRVTAVHRAGCGNQPAVGASWDTNNGGDFNFLRFNAIFDIEAEVDLSRGGFTDGFSIDFRAEQSDNTVVGIDFIEIIGCIEQEITSSNGGEFCAGKSTVLTANGIGTATDIYEWGTGTVVGSNIIPDESSNQIEVRPNTETTYWVRNIANLSEPLQTTITPVDCCGANSRIFTVPKTCMLVDIDGKPDEFAWGVAPWATVDKVSHVEGGVTANPAGRWRMLYDNEYVYLYAEIYDELQPYNSFWRNNLNNASNDNIGDGYKGDALEIYLDAGTTACGGNPLQVGLVYPLNAVGGEWIPGRYNNQACQTVSFNGLEARVSPWESTRTNELGKRYWGIEVKFPAARNGVNLSADHIRVEVGIAQSNSTSGTSQRGALLHTWVAQGDMYQRLDRLHDAPISDCASAVSDVEQVCAGGAVVLSTQVRTATATTYRWVYSTTGTGLPSTWANATVTGGDSDNNFVTANPTVRTWYAAEYDGVYSCPAEVGIISGVHITGTTPENPSRCGVGTVTLSATASAGNVSWYADLEGGTPLPGGDNIPSGSNWTTPSISATTSFYVEAVDNDCPGAARTEVLVTITGSIGGTASADQTICNGAQPADITLSGHSGSIQWQWSATNNGTDWADISSANSATLTSAQMGNLTATRYYRAFVLGTGCSDGGAASNTVTVSVTTDRPTFGTLTPQTICSGTAFADVNLSGGANPATSYTWTASVISGSITGLPTPPNGTVTNAILTGITLTNTGSTNGVVRYILTPGVAGCEGDPVNYDVTVLPAPTSVWNNPPAICPGERFADVAMTSGNAESFTWTASGTANGFTASGTSNDTTLMGETLTNDGTTSGIVTYVIIPRTSDGNGGYCTGSTVNIQVTVNPTPPAPTTTTVTYCAGAPAAALTAQGQQLRWFDADDEATLLSGPPIPLTNAVTDSRSYWVSQTVNGCESPRAELFVEIIASMQIRLIAQNETGETLPNNTSAIKRPVRLEVISVQGETPQNYVWSDNTSRPDGNEVWVFPLKTTTYSVVAKIDETCSAYDEITINVKSLPNAFIPSNGTGDINSVFPVEADAINQPVIKFKNMVIYNRYGQEVYNGNRRWDGTVNGKQAEPGTFFYIITFEDDETLKGTIEVIKN